MKTAMKLYAAAFELWWRLAVGAPLLAWGMMLRTMYRILTSCRLCATPRKPHKPVE